MPLYSRWAGFSITNTHGMYCCYPELEVLWWAAPHLTVLVGVTANSCVRYAIFMSGRAFRISPPSACRAPVMICSCVVLPAPLMPAGGYISREFIHPQGCICFICRLQRQDMCRRILLWEISRLGPRPCIPHWCELQKLENSESRFSGRCVINGSF